MIAPLRLRYQGAARARWPIRSSKPAGRGRPRWKVRLLRRSVTSDRDRLRDLPSVDRLATAVARAELKARREESS